MSHPTKLNYLPPFYSINNYTDLQKKKKSNSRYSKTKNYLHEETYVNEPNSSLICTNGD